MSEKEEKIVHPYSDITQFHLVAGRELTAEESVFERKVNEALANGWEIFWSPVVAKDVLMVVRRATSFPTAAQVSKDIPKPLTRAEPREEPKLTESIGAITADTKSADIQAMVISAGEIRTTKTGKVQNLVVEDLSGKIRLVLWNEEVGTLKEGDKFELEKGYVTVDTYQGNNELQLTRGKYGRITRLT